MQKRSFTRNEEAAFLVMQNTFPTSLQKKELYHKNISYDTAPFIRKDTALDFIHITAGYNIYAEA